MVYTSAIMTRMQNAFDAHNDFVHDRSVDTTGSTTPAHRAAAKLSTSMWSPGLSSKTFPQKPTWVVCSSGISKVLHKVRPQVLVAGARSVSSYSVGMCLTF